MLKNLTEAEKIIIVKMKTDEYYLLRQLFFLLCQGNFLNVALFVPDTSTVWRASRRAAGCLAAAEGLIRGASCPPHIVCRR